MDLGPHIIQYRLLKTYRDLLDRRLSDLNKMIKEEMQHKGLSSIHAGKASAVLRERNHTTYDQHGLMDLLKEKGLDECIKEVPDEQLVESAYLSGDLTDDDLREIRKPSYIIALYIEDVQS